MLRLLRTIRRRLVSDGPSDSSPRIRSYLLYALGEITLVVIGILIALQIGEWAQDREREAQVRAILVEIREDLIADARDLDDGIVQDHLWADSLLRFVQSDQVTRADFEARPYGAFYRLPFAVETFAPRRNGWDRLLRVEGEFPPRYAELREVLNDLYVDRHGAFALEESIAQERALANERWLIENTDWAWRFVGPGTGGSLPDEIIDWFHDGHMFRAWIRQMDFSGTRFQELYTTSVAAWAAIGGALGESVSDPLVPEGLLLDDPSRADALVGRWSWPEGRRRTEFFVRSGVLYQRSAFYFIPFYPEGPDVWRPFYQDPADRSVWRLQVDASGDTTLVREPPPGGTGAPWVWRREPG